MQCVQNSNRLDTKEVQNARRKDPVVVVQVPSELWRNSRLRGTIPLRVKRGRAQWPRRVHATGDNKEVGANIAKVEVEFKAAVAGGNTNSKSGRLAGGNEEKAETGGEEPVPMETASELGKCCSEK